MPLRPFCPALFAAGLAVAATAQQPPSPPSQPAPQQAPAWRGPVVHADRLHVKLAEGSGAELRGGRLRSRTGTDLTTVDAWLQWGVPEPLVTALSWDELDVWHRRACEVLPEGRRPGHMGLWFRLTLPSAELAAFVKQRLAADPLVEHVYEEPIAVPAWLQPPHDQPPPTPSFTHLQGSFEPAPSGMGIWQAQGVLGARGQDVRLVMVEIDWFLDHEDVPSLTPSRFLGVQPPGVVFDSWHGVGGASCLTAERNEYGMTGVVDEVDIRYLAFPQNGGTENAIMMAGASCQPGDVVMTVVQFVLGQYGPNDWVPIEFLQGAFDATLTVTANGRLLVNCAGNGGSSLDDPRFVRRFDRTFRDSGAIMVGASDGAALARAPFSNYGSRVDANGWGENCMAAMSGTLFFGNNDPRQAYTASYGGTSAASTTVCGVVAALQSAARRQLGRSLTTAEMRLALAAHGTWFVGSIAARPDLPATMRALGILDGLAMQAPDAPSGGQFTVQMEGPVGSFAALFGSFSAAAPGVDLGLNRRLHLDPATAFTVGFFALPQGAAAWSLAIPADPALRGTDLYFQAGRIAGSAPVHMTNSCQASVR